MKQRIQEIDLQIRIRIIEDAIRFKAKLLGRPAYEWKSEVLRQEIEGLEEELAELVFSVPPKTVSCKSQG